NSYKFTMLDAPNHQIVVGHVDPRRGWTIDARFSAPTVVANVDQRLKVFLKGNTVSLTLDGNAVASYSFNSLLNDGQIGLITNGGPGSYDEFTIRTAAPQLNTLAARASLPAAAEPASVTSAQAATLTDAQLQPIV